MHPSKNNLRGTRRWPTIAPNMSKTTIWDTGGNKQHARGSCDITPVKAKYGIFGTLPLKPGCNYISLKILVDRDHCVVRYVHMSCHQRAMPGQLRAEIFPFAHINRLIVWHSLEKSSLYTVIYQNAVEQHGKHFYLFMPIAHVWWSPKYSI